MDHYMTLTGHIAAVTSIAFSPNALLLASGCTQGWCNIWALQVKKSENIHEADHYVFM